MPKQYTIEQLFKLRWAELTTKEHATMLLYSAAMKAAKEKENHPLAGHYSILILRTLRKNVSAVAKINVEQAVDVINDITFFNEPWFNFPEVNKHQPADLLKHHTFGMLCRMDALFSKFQIQEHIDEHQSHPTQHPNGPISIQLQNDLLGIIYCKPEEYDERLIEQRGKEIAAIIKDEQRLVALATYANIKRFIIEGCPNMFPQPEEGEQPATGPQQPTDSEPLWEQLLFTLAESDAYKTMPVAKAANMYEALNYLEKKTIEALNAQANGKRATD